MAEGTDYSSRNIKANAGNIVQAAREMGIPIKTALDAFDGEPIKLLLAMHKRVYELRDESAESGEDFDAVRYISQSAQNRGWGKYAPQDAAIIDLSGIEDEQFHDRLMVMFGDDDEFDFMLEFLKHAFENFDNLRARIDAKVEQKYQEVEQDGA